MDMRHMVETHWTEQRSEDHFDYLDDRPPHRGETGAPIMPRPPIELDSVDDIAPEALDLTDEAARNDDPPWSEDDDEDTIPDDLDDDGEED